MLKQAKKGFSLIELLVVIAIIGILSAVGITAYSGYTADAKEQSTRAMHASMVSLINAELAKCSQGSGSFVWKVATAGTPPTIGGSAQKAACTTDPVAIDIIAYGNITLGMKNPHSVDAEGLAAATSKGVTQIVVSGAANAKTVTLTTNVDGTVNITGTIEPY